MAEHAEQAQVVDRGGARRRGEDDEPLVLGGAERGKIVLKP
ncbi:hypothetical protein [Nonomuraea angiospora]